MPKQYTPRPDARNGRGLTQEERLRGSRASNALQHQHILDYAVRFWGKVDKGPADACWLWTAGLATGGYGHFYCVGHHRLAHRVSYELTYGPIPDGLDVLHRCDVPACVRPDHLFLGTQRDNAHDCLMKGRWCDRTGQKTPNARLTNEQARCIYQRARAGERIIDLAREYGVSRTIISNIKRGVHYASATEQCRTRL